MASYFDQGNQSIVRQSQSAEQRFGVSLEFGDLVSPLLIPFNAVVLGKSVFQNYNRSWRSDRSDRKSRVNVNRHQFEINLDVQHFDANEITVKINGNTITIEGDHQEKHHQYGSVTRQFRRKYLVPNGHKMNKASSVLSSDGILVVSVPRHDNNIEDQVIPIVQDEFQNDQIEKKADEQQKQEEGKSEGDKVIEKKA